METSELIEILERPVRLCNLTHEDVQRNNEGTPLLPIILVPECDSQFQHIGCPHMFPKIEWGIRNINGLHAAVYEKNDLSETMLLVRSALRDIDDNIRMARLGAVSISKDIEVPNTMDVDAHVQTLLAEHAIFIQNHIEPLRIKLLEIVRSQTTT